MTEGEGSEPESSEAPVPPPVEVTMEESNDVANDSEQVKSRGPGRPRKSVEPPRTGPKDESRSPSQQASETHEKSDQELNSLEAGDKEVRNGLNF